MKSVRQNQVHRLMRILLEILFPMRCVGCDEKGTSICKKCAAHLTHAAHTPTPDIYALFDYHDPLIKRLLWDYKFLGRKHLAVDLATLLYDGVLEMIADMAIMHPSADILLTSVPGSTKRVRSRSYDQGILLRRELMSMDTADLFESEKTLLVRESRSHPQTEIRNRQKRIANIRGAFMLHPNAKKIIKNRNVLLIDDVTTTGATLREARKTLLDAGAKRVICVSLSH